MPNDRRILPSILRSIAIPAILFAALAAAQTKPSAPAPAGSPASEQDLAATQETLLKLLRISPTLTSVVEHDPSLLSNQEYVQRNNPELAQFLVSHPEIARNPEFYLFTNIGTENGRRDKALQRAVWPELVQGQLGRPASEEFISDMPPVLAVIGLMAALVWLIRQFMLNRRWSRIFKLQSEVHGKLIDRFTSSQELALYMDSEAGKRFLEAAPIPMGFEPEQQVPNALARVLAPLQIGIVMVLLGIGLLALRKVSPGLNVPMLVLGTVVAMPGLGFIISAGITWLLAGRLGLMPALTSSKPAVPFDTQDRQ